MVDGDPERRAPHGARGLKHKVNGFRRIHGCRAPHGARGLKHDLRRTLRIVLLSRPARGAWIETSVMGRMRSCYVVAPRTGRVD